MLAAIPAVTGVDTIRRLDVPATVTVEQAQMERVGVFGTLSVSFLMSALMAALGLLTYSYASLHERLFQFSVLRCGDAAARPLGHKYCWNTPPSPPTAPPRVWSSARLPPDCFVPLFRVSGDGPMPLPPLLPVVAHDEILPLVFGFAEAMIVLELVVLSSALYQRIFVALRMGNQA
ncbi:MAG: hypothetical protein R2856_08980 [Caldilineaceae bacterium]